MLFSKFKMFIHLAEQLDKCISQEHLSGLKQILALKEDLTEGKATSSDALWLNSRLLQALAPSSNLFSIGIDKAIKWYMIE